MIKAGLVYNEALHEYVAAKDKWLKTKSPDDLNDCRNRLRTAELWKARWTELRSRPEASTFYIRASSYVNADILTEEWFSDAIAAKLPDLNTAILSEGIDLTEDGPWMNGVKPASQDSEQKAAGDSGQSGQEGA